MTEMTEDFDLDGWISGARLPERVCTVYGRGDLVAEAELLREQIEDDDANRAPGMLIGGASPELRDRLSEVTRQFEASALTIRLRAWTLDGVREITSRLGKDATDDQLTYGQLSGQIVSPEMTETQVQRLRGVIGEGQWQHLVATANSAGTDRQIDIPFSSAASVASRASSRN